MLKKNGLLKKKAIMKINILKYGVDYFVVIIIAIWGIALCNNKPTQKDTPIYIDPPIKQTVWYC